MDVEPYAVLSGTGLLDKSQDKSQAESHAESVSVETIKGFAALNPPRSACPRRGWTPAQVAWLLNYGESKVRMLIITGRLRSIKDGRSRRILPEWRINPASLYTVIVGRGVSGGM